MIEAQAEKIEIIKQLPKDELLSGIVEFCKKQNFGLAAWRLPEESDLQVIIDDSNDWSLNEDALEDQNEGFIFSPFNRKKKKYYLKAILKINISQRKVERCENEGILKSLESFLTTNSQKKTNKEQTFTEEKSTSDDYESLVSTSIERIKSGDFQKVVPSRNKKINLSKGFSPALHFLKLEDQYKKSFISLVYTPDTNLWIGATPEILIQTRGSQFKTVALAGTQKHSPDVPLSDISWTQKEIEEQAFVSRYIINCFKKIRLREFDELGPKTVVAGNLIHLKTEFTVDMKATNFPQLGSVMLELLHPTSAICGMPLESAYNFLKENEGYDRKFFSGYLGPVNIENDTSIFVNLRCMEIIDDTGVLYAGAGVTEDSNPHKEWLETEMKMNTLLNVIKH